MALPYLRKLESIPPFTVWEVSGAYVRQNLSEEFTNFSHHYVFSFIPKYEFWIDKEFSHDESTFYIDHLLTEWRLMSRGENYDEAHRKACQVESRERHKSKFSLETPVARDPKLIKRVHRELLKTYSNAFVSVWVVRGELVRDKFFVDFTEGGHDFVYRFVPLGEVWIDDELGQNEDRRFVILHELHERALMAKGSEYVPAHRSASKIEHYCRQHPEALEECLKEARDQNYTKLTPNPTLYEVATCSSVLG